MDIGKFCHRFFAFRGGEFVKKESNGFVGTVAEWRVGCVLALAEPRITGFFGGEFLWRKSGSFVGAVAEWLRGGFSAGAIKIIFSGFEGNFDRGFRGDGWCAHRREGNNRPFPGKIHHKIEAVEWMKIGLIRRLGARKLPLP